MKELLEGKVAVVTGGTRGIGLAIVKRFIEEGAAVVLFGSRRETAVHTYEQLKEAYPNANLNCMWPSLTNEDAVRMAFDDVMTQFGHLDILVNNAGISQSTPLTDYTLDEFDQIIDLNVKAAFVCSRAAATLMKPQGGGVILSTSSIVSLYGQPSGVGYPTSKFAINGLTKSLARELGPYHIRVNAVAPGVVETDMVRALPQSTISPLVHQIPLGRMAQPIDIANAFLFLASDMASYVSGEILSVDGAAII